MISHIHIYLYIFLIYIYSEIIATIYIERERERDQSIPPKESGLKFQWRGEYTDDIKEHISVRKVTSLVTRRHESSLALQLTT